MLCTAAAGSAAWWDYAMAFSNPDAELAPAAPVEDANVADWTAPP